MKKGYYIHFGNGKTSGVAKKIRMQMEEFSKFYQMEEIVVEDSPRSLAIRIIGLLPYNSIARDYESALQKLDAPDFVYMRRAVADKEYCLFLREIKKKFPTCKIIVEIFTYPYDRDEFAKWNAWPFYFKELIYRKNLRDVVGRFVTYSADSEIFGIPCINTMNGVRVDQIKAVSPQKVTDGIHLIAVANFLGKHGYERVIEGLHEYDQSKGPKVYLDLVGSGRAEKKYRRLVKKWKLEDYVIFHGLQYGSDLEKLYNRADIALGPFGLYKVGIQKISSLKTSEYLAKGLPVAGGCQENAFESGCIAYYKEFPNDRSAIDIKQIVNFYQEVYAEGKAAVIARLRSYAEVKVDMNRVLLPVFAYIDEN